jgi:hypothetical protein
MKTLSTTKGYRNRRGGAWYSMKPTDASINLTGFSSVAIANCVQDKPAKLANGR